MFLDKSLRLIDVLYKQARFFTLMFVGTCCALIYPFYDLMPHHLYFTSISFFVALFSINETYISYTRVPFMVCLLFPLLSSFFFLMYSSFFPLVLLSSPSNCYIVADAIPKTTGVDTDDQPGHHRLPSHHNRCDHLRLPLYWSF